VVARPARGPAAFAGTFALRTRTTVTVTAPLQQTETRQTQDVAVIRAITGAGAQLEFQVTSEHGDRCVLHASARGASAVVFVPGERCDVVDPVQRVPLTLTLADGTGTLSGDTLTLRLNWSVASNGFLFPLSGTATQASSGRRR
jgi:hypothetical protein